MTQVLFAVVLGFANGEAAGPSSRSSEGLARLESIAIAHNKPFVARRSGNGNLRNVAMFVPAADWAVAHDRFGVDACQRQLTLVFTDALRDALDVSRDFDVARLKLTSAFQVNEATFVCQGFATKDGIRVENASVSFVFDGRGNLIGFSGRIDLGHGVEVPSSVDMDFILGRAAEYLEFKRGVVVEKGERVVRGGRPLAVYKVGDAYLGAERVLDPRHGGVVWRFASEDQEVTIDEATGALVRSQSTADDFSHVPKNITHQSLSPTGLGTKVISTKPASVSRYNLGFFGLYKLEYGKYYNFDNYIHEIESHLDNPTHYPLLITPTGFPVNGFLSTSGNRFDMQTAYYWALRSRETFLAARAAAYPSNPDDVVVKVHTNNRCNSSACFKKGHIFATPSINLDRNEWDHNGKPDPTTVAHEYGHFVVFTYGDVDNDCIPGIDESNSVDEGVADAWAQLVTVRELPGKANRQFESNSLWNPGTNYPMVVPGAGGSCGSIYDYGNGFKEAVWEIIYGVDCQNYANPSSCNFWTTSNNARGELGWSNTSTAHTTNRVARALGYAMAATGSEPTYTDVGFWMHFWLRYMSGESAAFGQEVRDVLAYHGCY